MAILSTVREWARRSWTLLKCAVTHWSADQAATLGAALAFYCAFSLAPLLRLLSFGLILAVGFLLLISLTITTALSRLREAILHRFEEFVVLTGALDFVLSLALTVGLFSLIFRYMPARQPPENVRT